MKVINLNSDIKYLMEYSSDIWDFSKGLPTGIFYKKFTGLGATTCEILSPRNSILVFPTVSLASSKSNQTKEKVDKGGLKLQVYYVGGGVKNSDISEFVESISKDLWVKFFVVADSLPRLIEILGPNVYENYFLMVDEIDTFQIDTSYRVSLEYAVDYFKEFKEKCALTATLIPFSDLEFNEPNIDYWVVNKELNEKPELQIIESLDPISTIVEQIQICIAMDEKVVVALNSISQINRICKELVRNYGYKKDEIGILCSYSSKHDIYHMTHWIPIHNDGEIKIENKLIFMTSSYFVGIDILDLYHLIIVNYPYPDHAILSFEKIYQITGRARNGTFSIILISPPTIEVYKDHFDLDDITSRIARVNEVLEFSEEVYSDQDYNDDFISLNSSILNTKIAGMDGFLRLNKNGVVVPSSFTVDYKNHFYSSIKEYNIGLVDLERRLSDFFTVKRDFVMGQEFDKRIESFSPKDFVVNYTEQISNLIQDIVSEIVKNNEHMIQGIFSPYLFDYIKKRKSNKKVYTICLQFALFWDIYDDLDLTKKALLEYNDSNKIKIKEFGELLYLYKFYFSPEYQVLKKYLEIDSEYTADELVGVIRILSQEVPGLLKYFNDKKINQTAYVLKALRVLLDFNEVPRQNISGTSKKSSKKYKLKEFKSCLFERKSISSNNSKVADFLGSSLRAFLLKLENDDIRILLS